MGMITAHDHGNCEACDKAEAELERLRAGIREAMKSRNELDMFHALQALLKKPGT